MRNPFFRFLPWLAVFATLLYMAVLATGAYAGVSPQTSPVPTVVPPPQQPAQPTPVPPGVILEHCFPDSQCVLDAVREGVRIVFPIGSFSKPVDALYRVESNPNP